MGFGINPEEGVIPAVCEFDFDQVIASRASRATMFEDRVRAFAVAASTFQHELSPLVPCDSGGTARFAEGSHFRRLQP